MATEDIKLEHLDLATHEQHRSVTPASEDSGELHNHDEQDTQSLFVSMDNNVKQSSAPDGSSNAEDLLTYSETPEQDHSSLSAMSNTFSGPSSALPIAAPKETYYQERKPGGSLFLPNETLATVRRPSIPNDITPKEPPASDRKLGSRLPTPANSEKDERSDRQSIPTGVKRVKAEPVDTFESKPRKKQRVNPNQVQPYDDNTEKDASQLAVDKPCFVAAEKLVPIICDKVLRKIDGLYGRGYSDEEIAAICGKLKELRYVRRAYPGASIVGFLGDTAAGKSSLINCLINQENIVGENDDGDSGTSVPQELAIADVDQVEAIKAVVYYATKRKISAQILQHFKDIYEYRHTDQSELDKDEQKTLYMSYHSALSFFITLLCDKEEFKTVAAAEAFFARAQSENDETLLGCLQTYVTDYMSTLGRVGGATTIYGNTMSQVNRQLKIFRGPVKTQEGANPVASPWPLVSRIATHLKARILSEGLTLADLPGTSDVNRLRVQATRDYLKNCDTIVIPHPILRIQSQDSVWTNIMECLRAGKQSSIILVCTKIDDMKHGRERDSVSSYDQTILDGLRSQFDALTQSIDELQEKLEDAEDDGDYIKIDRQLKRETLQRAAKEAEWKEEGILARNRRNVAELKKQFREYTRSSEDVPVFCVSNTIYQEHMHGYDRGSPPQLSLEATDIPRLRNHLFQIPARRKLAALFKLCKKSLPRVLLAIEMQCSKTRLERKQDVEKRVVRPLANFTALTANLKSVLKHEFESMLQDVITNCEDSWRSEAKKYHDGWVKFKYSRYGAFCRRYGQWKDASKQDIDWNVNISEIAQENLLDGFTHFKTTMSSVQDTLRKNLDDSLAQLDTNLSESPELMGLDLSSFHKLIDINRTNVDEEITKQFRKLEKTLNMVRYNATSIETEDSYLIASMTPAYEACKARYKQQGAGVFKDAKEIMSKKLYGPKNVFLDIRDRAVAVFEKQVDGWVASVDKRIGNELEEIVKDFNNRFDNVEKEDPEKRGFRQELLGTVKEAMEIMETDMAEQLAACAGFR